MLNSEITIVIRIGRNKYAASATWKSLHPDSQRVLHEKEIKFTQIRRR
jgi:hypothetical protein